MYHQSFRDLINVRVIYFFSSDIIREKTFLEIIASERVIIFLFLFSFYIFLYTQKNT